MGQTQSSDPIGSISLAKNSTRGMSAGDWVRLQRLRGARSYTADLVTNKDIAPTPFPQLSYKPGMGVFKVGGTTKARRTASQWTDLVASQRADFVTTSQTATTGVAVTESVTKLCNCSSAPMPVKDIVCKRCVGITSTHAVEPPPCLAPTITNISSDEPFNGPWHITWDEAHVLSRSVTVGKSGDSYPSSISDLQAGSCTFTDPNDGSGSYEITITVTGCNGQTATAVQVIGVPCFLGCVLLETKNGPVKIEDIAAGSEMLQPDGTYSKVVETTKTTIKNDFGNSSRLYADESEKCIVTWWHKVRFSDETEEVRAGEHSRMHRVHREYPFDVFHLKLEHPDTDKILVHETEIIAEGFVRPEPIS
jgi:hypothetical protein